MNRLVDLLAFSIMSLVANAQNVQYRFVYDESGNCTSRTIVHSTGVIPGSGPFGKSQEDDRNTKVDGKAFSVITEKSGKDVVVEIPNLQSADKCTIGLYDLSGRRISEIQTKSFRTSIDLSSLNTGVYLIVIDLNGEKNGVKITKE